MSAPAGLRANSACPIKSANPSVPVPDTNRSFTVSTDKWRLNLPWVVNQIKWSYWGSWLEEGQILAAIENSTCFGLYMDDLIDSGEIVATGRQVGFCRVVGDGHIFSSIMDVVIEEELRCQGLGTILMKEVVKHPSVAKTINILSTRDALGFYENHGWQVVPFGVMKRVPQ